MRKLAMLFVFLFFPFVVFSQEGGMHSYYNSVNWNQSSDNLKSALNTLISTSHTNLPYTSDSEDTWDVLRVSDLISGSNNVSLIYGYNNSDADTYNDISRDRDLMSSGTCTGYWNREHIFPKSLATPALDTDSPGSGTDLHNLRAADCQMNSTRNNNVYGDGSGDSVLNSGVFFPGDGTGTGGDDYRGDVARAIMYMYVRYPSQINPNNVASSNNTYHDDMPDIFLEWNQADPPSAIEILRNDTFHTEQLNRNPFVDNPYIAELIWGGPSVTAWWDLAAPRISFSSNSSSVSETNGDVSTNISISMYNYDAAVSISVSVNGSSTAENGDYTLNTSSLTFNSNGSQNISVTTKNDDDNHDETIILDVSITSDAADPDTATLTIKQHTISVTDDEKELIITELADPQNSSTAGRHVEVYNSSNKSVDLSTYYLLRWTNNSATASEKTSLSTECGSTLAPNAFCVISNDTNSGTKFSGIYGFEPDGKHSASQGAANSNGDDNIAIVTSSGGITLNDSSTWTVVDMFGVVGEDGSGTAHEFEDGRAERKASSTIPSTSWNASEWNIDNDGGAGDGNLYAPAGYDPGYWIGATDVDTWTGRSNASWATAGNWSSGVVPASGDKVFIHDATNSPDISTDISITDLTVKANGVLDIESTGSLSLSGNFSNSGTVTLNSTSSRYSSIKVGGTSSGNITYNRYVNSLSGWDLIGSPVNGLQISSFVTTNTGGSSPLATGNGSGAGDVGEYAIGTYDPSNNTWTNYTSSNVSTTQFTPGKGYQMATDSGATMAFTGTIDTDATETISVESFTDASGRRWNLISNPYPSFIKIGPSTDDNTFLEVNDDVIDDTYEGVYGYDAVADPSTYTIINNLSGVTSIAPGQGFFVAARSTTATNITFKKEMQTTSTGDDFISGDVFQHAEVELRLFNNDNLMGKTNLFFVEGLTLGLDPGYDAGGFTQNDPLMTRLVENDEGHGMAINAMGLDAMENAVIPLVINQSAGQEFRVSLHNANVNGAYVYLEDSLVGEMIDLKAGDFALTPTSDLGGVGRFFIHITADTMSNGEISTSLLNAYKKVDSSYITIEGLATQSNNINVSLYNILGTEVLSTTLYNNMNTQTISTVGMATGIYIIELESGRDRLTKKFIIH